MTSLSQRLGDLGGKLDRLTRHAGDQGPLGERRSTPFWASAAVFLLLFFAARLTLELDGLTTGVRVAIALAPLPAFLWFLREFVRAVSSGDELERRMQLEALAIAFPSTVILLMTLGLLQIAVPLSEDDWSYRHIWPIIYVFYLMGLTWARRRYR